MPNYVTNQIVTSNADDFEKMKALLLDDDENVDFNRVIPMPESLNTGPSPTLSTVVDNAAKLAIIDPERRKPYQTILEQCNISSIDKTFYSISSWGEYFKNKVDEYLASEDDVTITLIEQGRTVIYMQNLKIHKCHSWYEWSWRNWGTKWNANGTALFQKDVSNNDEVTRYYTIGFETAWSTPVPVLHELSKSLQDPIQVYWIDEQAFGFDHDDIVFDTNITGCDTYANGSVSQEDVVEEAQKLYHQIFN